MQGDGVSFQQFTRQCIYEELSPRRAKADVNVIDHY